MKYLSVFNELKYTTYKSAIDKLGSLGHSKRAKRMKKHAQEFGTGGAKLEDPSNYFSDSHPFKISISRSGDEYIFVVDNTFFITGYKITTGLNILMTSVDDQEISIDVIFRDPDNKTPYMGHYYHDLDKLKPNQSWGIFNSLQITRYSGSNYKESSWFKFKNRRDAVVFRDFLIAHFPGHDMNKIRINDIYKE